MSKKQKIIDEIKKAKVFVFPYVGLQKAIDIIDDNIIDRKVSPAGLYMGIYVEENEEPIVVGAKSKILPIAKFLERYELYRHIVVSYIPFSRYKALKKDGYFAL